MSMCRVFSCVVGRECLLWPESSLGKTLLAFALLYFVLQGQICLLLQVSLDFLFLHSSPLWWKGYHFGVLVLDGLVDLHQTIQLLHFQHYWLGYRLVVLWYWMVCLGNKQRAFCCFWDCTHVLHFGPFCDYEGYSISSKEFLPTVVDIMVIWIKLGIKKRWQEFSEELNKKDLNDPDNHNGVITYLESDILECEVKWALESITINKASGSDGIAVELFQILKDDAVKVLHSVWQQI